jgi:hypothetical protein
MNNSHACFSVVQSVPKILGQTSRVISSHQNKEKGLYKRMPGYE